MEKKNDSSDFFFMIFQLLEIEKKINYNEKKKISGAERMGYCPIIL